MRRAKWSIYLLSLVVALAFGIGVSEPAEAAAGWTPETGTLIITSAEDYDTLQPHYREQATTLIIKADVPNEEGVHEIPDRAFENFTALQTVTFETTGTTKIGDRAFSGCSALTSFTIPRTVTTIGDRAFSGCKNLASIALQDSVTSIGDYAFSGCSALTSIALPDSVTELGQYAFENCTALESVTLSKKLEFVSMAPFSGCTSIKRLDQVINLPSAIPSSFFANTGFETLELSDEQFTSIGSGAFSSCQNLKTVSIDKDITLGESIFANCTNLANVTLPDELESIDASMFEGCTFLENVKLPTGLKSIGDNAFYQCEGLSGTLNLPDSLESIGTNAFYGCTGLSGELNLPDSMERIGQSAFYECTGLSGELDLPDSLEELGTYAFAFCSGLTDITIPDGVSVISDAVFYGCSDLKSITFPQNLSAIGENAFYQCTSLENIALPDSLETIGPRAFTSCSNLTEIKIPATVTSVGENAFTGCSGLTSVEYTQHLDLTEAGIPETVTTWTVQPDNDHHDWSLSGWEWAEDYSSATATFICSKDYMKDHITQVECTTIGSYIVQPTCTTDGSTTYTATVTFNGQNFTTQQTEVLTKLGHDWGTWMSNDNGTHSHSCQRDGCNATETEDCTYNETGHCTVCGAAQSFAVTVSDGTGSGTYKVGESVTITATAPEGQEFVRWNITPEVTFTNGSATTTTATFIMPVNNVTVTAVFKDETVEEPTGPETPSTPSTPSLPSTPSEPEEPSGPSTGDSEGWDSIRDEIAGAEDGDTITIDMNGETEVPAEIFETLAGKDVTIEFDMGDGVSWSVNGADIPADADLSDLNLGVSMNTSGIPVDVINAITGEATSVQITLAHDGDFGFALTLSAPLGEENAGYWANLYHFDEDAERMDFETAALIDDDGTVKLRLTHASQYAIVIDDHSHAPMTTLPFTDVNADDWFYDPVVWAYDEGLMTGTSATTFEPNTSTTRAMIVAILNRLEGGPTADGETFTDVHNGDWYAEAVNWAASVGIVAGFEDGSFRPNAPITREQMAAILYNYAQWKGYDVSSRADLSRYSDQPSEWAEDVMQWAVAEGLISGTSATTLDPQGTATRAQVASILQRFLTKA